MRRALLALSTLALAACSLALDPGKYVGDGAVSDTGATDAPHDGGSLDMPTTDMPATDMHATDMPATDMPSADMPSADLGPCTTDPDCGTTSACVAGTCMACDADGDGFVSDAMYCNGVATALHATDRDCDDTQATVYPNAPAICGDGLENSCHRAGTGAPDWSSFFTRTGFAEAGPVPPSFVIGTSGTRLDVPLSLTTTAPPASAPTSSMMAVVGYSSSATNTATMATATLSPTAIGTATIVPLTISGAPKAVEVRRDSSHTIAYATVDSDPIATVDTIVDGNYDPYSTAPSPTVSVTNTLGLNAVQPRVAFAGGYSFADSASHPLDLFVRWGTGASVTTQYVAVWAGSGLNSMTGTPFTGGPALYGSANQYVIGANAGGLVAADPAVGTSVSVMPAWMVGARPQIVAGMDARSSVAAYLAGTQFVFVPLQCGGSTMVFRENCADGLTVGSPTTFTPSGGMPNNFTATEASNAAAGAMIATGDLEDVTLPDGTSARHVLVRLFNGSGSALASGDPAFWVPLAMSGTTLIFDDLQVASVYPPHDATMPAPEAYIVVASTTHTSGSSSPSDVSIGALHFCHTL